MPCSWGLAFSNVGLGTGPPPWGLVVTEGEPNGSSFLQRRRGAFPGFASLPPALSKITMSEILEDPLSLCHLRALLSSPSTSASLASSSLASFLVLLNRLPASPLVEHLSHVRC